MEAAGAVPGVLSPGDWVCGDSACGNVNFSRRSACNRCGRKRGVAPAGSTEIGKSAADKSRGLFSADDWQCSKCANVNWARRLTCNVCNAPKFQEVEARTGYGGGYDERGIVEYRQRRDSDDDVYDEFGRVKKRKGKDRPSQSKVCGERRRPSAPGDGGATPASSAERRKRASEGTDDDADAPGERPQRRRTRTEEGEDVRRRLDRSFGVRPRSGECIMENRVSSTNDVKYTFRGKTADENFEVTYTLQERIKVAAWAIAFQNCKMSAHRFQNEFDKPAPDFKTIFAWRQRLLDAGCLVDAHRTVEDHRAEARDGRFRKRRRRRYFETAALSESSEDSDRGEYGRSSFARRSKGDSGADRCRRGSEVESAGPIDKALSTNENNTNGSIGHSSTSGAKRSNLDGSKRSDCCMTDVARSETPEITVARVELALLKSPNRIASPETQFREDDYFDDISKTTDKPVPASSFLVPEIPKQTKEKSPKIIDDISKSMLEDIVSESERYSSDGDHFGSDINDDDYEGFKSHSINKTQCSLNSKDSEKNANKNDAIDPIDLPLPKFRHRTVSNNNADGSGKNFSSAMRRIIENLTNKSEEKEASNIEYVPTKIDPAMAKKNHQLFESIHDIWPEANSCSIDIPVSKKPKTDRTKINYENYTPDDDVLYRNESSEQKSDDEILRTPPRAPNIGSLCSKTKNLKDINVENINKLLQFNLSSINTDDIALALKNIQSLSSIQDTNGEVQNECNKEQQSLPIKKNDNIPFLDDMFYPGSPSCRSLENNVDRDILDELGESRDVKKCNSIISGFKSFAIPKPIMLNRLRNLNRNENSDSTIQNSEDVKFVKLSKIEKLKRKTNQDNGFNNKDDTKKLYSEEKEDDEDSEEGDLSKYDLWGSDDEGKNKGTEKESKANVSSEKDPKVTLSDNKKSEKSNSLCETSNNRRNSERSRSASSRRSSSSSSSTTSSSSRPRNRYDDFILNSEHSRGGSRDDSSSARSRSPFSSRGRERDTKKSRSRDRTKDKSRDNRDRDRNQKFRDGRDLNKSRDKGRDRDRDRQRHHKGHVNHGGYSRGRAR